jgi:hypothetical protein
MITPDKPSLSPETSIHGSVMYAMTGTWPDLAFTVGCLSQHSMTPGSEHLAALKQVYCYLLKTKDMSLTFDGTKSNILQGFTDSDWGGNPTDQRSITGILWILCSALVGWSSWKQSTVVLSSTEAEYIAVMQGTHNALWFHYLLSDFDFPMSEPTVI